MRDDLAAGPVRDLLVGTGTQTIVVSRLEHHDDGYGLVCIDWVDRNADLPAEALELVDYFISSPTVVVPRSTRSASSCGRPEARLEPATQRSSAR
ncbi:MAG: hypothetical protein ACR2QO_18190 [Acidimicrobiales bacterium]